MDTPKLIKTIRMQLGMSQEAFAKVIHVAFSTVNRWENNHSIPNNMARALIANYCEKRGIDKELIDAIRSRGR